MSHNYYTASGNTNFDLCITQSSESLANQVIREPQKAGIRSTIWANYEEAERMREYLNSRKQKKESRWRLAKISPHPLTLVLHAAAKDTAEATAAAAATDQSAASSSTARACANTQARCLQRVLSWLNRCRLRRRKSLSDFADCTKRGIRQQCPRGN